MSTQRKSSQPTSDLISDHVRASRASKLWGGLSNSRLYETIAIETDEVPARSKISQFQIRLSDRIGRKYECEICAKRFASLILLQLHHNVHASRLEDIAEISDSDCDSPDVVPVAAIESTGPTSPVTVSEHVPRAKSEHIAESTAITQPTHKCSKGEKCGKWQRQQRMLAQLVARDSLISNSSVASSNIHYSRQSRGSRAQERDSNGVFDDESFTHRDHRRRSLSLSPVRVPHIEMVPPTPYAENSDWIASDNEMPYSESRGYTNIATNERTVEEPVPEASQACLESYTQEQKLMGPSPIDLVSGIGPNAEIEDKTAERATRELFRKLDELEAAAMKHISDITADEDALEHLSDRLLQKLHEAKHKPNVEEHKTGKKVQMLVTISKTKRAAEKRREKSRDRKIEFGEFYASLESWRKSNGLKKKRRTKENVDTVEDVVADVLPVAGLQSLAFDSTKVEVEDNQSEIVRSISSVGRFKPVMHVQFGLLVLGILLGISYKRILDLFSTYPINHELLNHTNSTILGSPH